jgi:glycosyltransferase involved in cell wall biosynthesis
VARLGVYTDAVYGVAETESGRRITADPIDYAFLLFVREVARHFDEYLLVGRVGPESEAQVPLPEGTRLAELPHYQSLADIGRVIASVPGAARGFWKAVGQVDVVWAFGPHPLALVLVAIARLRRRRVVLGIRQDTIAYFRSRVRGGSPKLLLARLTDASFRALARRHPVTAVGEELAARYGRGRARALAMTVSLVSEEDVQPAVPARSWERVELVTAGRIEPEKNPLLLVEALAELERERPGRFRLVWLGGGTLEPDARARARELGVAGLIDFRGYVPFGPAVLEALRRANVFVLASSTEGVPQALVEAMACGTPIVSTDVGGIRQALENGEAGLLVPSNDARELAGAVMRVADDAPLRDRLAGRGLALVRDHTLEGEAGRVARFVAGS